MDEAAKNIDGHIDLRDEFIKSISGTELLAELFRRGLARQIEHRVFVDGLQLRASSMPEAAQKMRANAQAVSNITRALLEQGLVSFGEEDAGPDYAPGSKVFTAILGVLT